MATKLKVNKMGYVLAYNECKGSVQCKTDLPTDAEVGDVYNVLDEDGTYYHYDGSSWSCCECELEIEGGGGGSVSPDLSEINEALDNALYKAGQGESVEIEGDIIEYALKSELTNLQNWVGTYKDIAIGAVTMNQYGYLVIEELIKAQIPEIREIINVNIINWNGTTPPYGVTAQGSYLFGGINASFTEMWLRVFYR